MAAKKAKGPGGRPALYTKEIADIVCQRLACGESMRSVSRDEAMPGMTTLFKWIREIEEFSTQYDKAKVESADALVEDMLDIADNQAGQTVEIDGEEVSAVTAVGVSHAKLRVDTRKWAASKLKPKKYGDKIQQEHSGNLNLSNLTDDELAQRLMQSQHALKNSEAD